MWIPSIEKSKHFSLRYNVKGVGMINSTSPDEGRWNNYGRAIKNYVEVQKYPM